MCAFTTANLIVFSSQARWALELNRLGQEQKLGQEETDHRVSPGEFFLPAWNLHDDEAETYQDYLLSSKLFCFYFLECSPLTLLQANTQLLLTKAPKQTTKGDEDTKAVARALEVPAMVMATQVLE